MSRSNLLNKKDLIKVYEKSKARNYSMSETEMQALIKKHRQLAKRLAMIEAQFEDINYHDICKALSNYSYGEALNLSTFESTKETYSEDNTPSYFQSLTEQEKATLKATILQGGWGDTYIEFVNPNNQIETVGCYGYCTNDIKVDGIPSKNLPSIFKSMYSKLCSQGNKGEVVTHISDWWGDGTGDMLFVRGTHQEEVENWARTK